PRRASSALGLSADSRPRSARNGMKGCCLVCIALLVSSPAQATSNGPSPEALMESGHWKQARTWVERLARTDPDDAVTAYLLSRVRLAFGDLESALSLAQKAVL